MHGFSVMFNIGILLEKFLLYSLIWGKLSIWVGGTIYTISTIIAFSSNAAPFGRSRTPHIWSASILHEFPCFIEQIYELHKNQAFFKFVIMRLVLLVSYLIRELHSLTLRSAAGWTKLWADVCTLFYHFMPCEHKCELNVTRMLRLSKLSVSSAVTNLMSDQVIRRIPNFKR